MTQTAETAHQTGRYSELDDESHIWEIADELGTAAALYVSVENREIMQVEVREDRRREGLATALYDVACAQMDIYHAPAAHRTYEGHAFAESVGGETLTCLHGCCDTEE